MKILAFLMVMVVSAWAEDWTVEGKTYHNVVVGQIEADQVHITYDGGIGAIPMAKLEPDVQKRLGYDPEKAATMAQIRALQAQVSDLTEKNAELRYMVSQYKGIANAQANANANPPIGIEAYHCYLYQTVVSLVRGARVFGGPYDKMTEDKATAEAQQKWGELSDDEKMAYEKMAQQTGDPIARQDAIDAANPGPVSVRVLQGQGQ